jgi:urease accessory protein
MKQENPDGDLGAPFATWLTEPLMQRSPGSTGKNGVCDLRFGVSAHKTRLLRSFVSHPFHLTHPWHLDDVLPGMAVLYVQMPAGGLIQGDRTTLQFVLEDDAQVHITTQAAEKIHSMTANCAVQHVQMNIGVNAYAEYCPEPMLLFPGSRFAQEIIITLAAGAALFFSEMFLAPTLYSGAPFAGLANRLHVRTEDTHLLFSERNLVLPNTQPLDAPGILGPAQCWGQAFFVTNHGSTRLCPRQLHERLESETGILSGVSTLPGGRGVITKAFGTDPRALRAVLFATWDYVRTMLTGARAPVFPK